MPEPETIPFTPVLLRRTHRNGWTPDRQREFIAALARCGSVTAAARSVGLSPRSAYALLDKPDSDSFAEAWDLAVVMGIDALRDSVIDRATNGAWVPITRRGKITGKRFKYFDTLAIAVLSGRGVDIVQQQEDRARARAARQEWRERDRAEAAASEELARRTKQELARCKELNRQHRADAVRIRFL